MFLVRRGHKNVKLLCYNSLLVSSLISINSGSSCNDVPRFYSNSESGLVQGFVIFP